MSEHTVVNNNLEELIPKNNVAKRLQEDTVLCYSPLQSATWQATPNKECLGPFPVLRKPDILEANSSTR